MLYGNLQTYARNIARQFNTIPAERKAILQQIVDWIGQKMASKKSANLVFICTHNARRSHLAEAWAAAAAHYYDVEKVQGFSGGVEVTAMHPNAVASLQRAGMRLRPLETGSSENPHYELDFSADAPTKELFSKAWDDNFNPNKNFAAILVCSAAEEACPMINAAEKRVLLSYDDPKESDGTEQESAVYDERSRQIATEMFYVFSRL